MRPSGTVVCSPLRRCRPKLCTRTGFCFVFCFSFDRNEDVSICVCGDGCGLCYFFSTFYLNISRSLLTHSLKYWGENRGELSGMIREIGGDSITARILA